MEFKLLRERMVEEQLARRHISDLKILGAFRKVPRHEFVPDEYKDAAYDDYPLPIGRGQTISQPYMVALMTECMELKSGDKVLEVGSGSGYQAAILAEIVKDVYSVERIEILATKSEEILKSLGYGNVHVVVGDGSMGYKDGSPYDGIIVTCAAPSIPDAYIEQLKVGGRLVIPVGSRFSQVLTVVEKNEAGIDKREVCGCVFVPLIGEKGWTD